jgi:hypothetical protein
MSNKYVDSDIDHGQSTVVSDKNPPVHESLYPVDHDNINGESDNVYITFKTTFSISFSTISMKLKRTDKTTQSQKLEQKNDT